MQPIYYARKTLTDAQENYNTIENKLLAVAFALENFRPYLVLSKVIVYTDYSRLRYLLTITDSKPRLFRWILLIQKFDLEIKGNRGVKNLATDHLSHLEKPTLETIKEKTPMMRFQRNICDKCLNASICFNSL